MSWKDLIPSGKKDVPVKKEEMHPFAVFQQEMNSLFDQFMRGFDVEPFFKGKAGSFSPHIDVVDGDKEILVTAELPGMDEKDIEVSLTPDALVIKGEKKEEKEEKKKDYYRMERSYGSFSRIVPLPTEINTGAVEASFKKGVLTVKLPKTEKAIQETKRIAVKSE